MDHSLAIRKDPERVWDVPGSETGSRRDRGSTSSYEFPEEKTASVCRRITADPGSSIGNLCDHADGNRILMDRDDHHDSRIRTQLQVHRKKRKKLVHLPQTDAPDILPIQTK